MSAEQIRGGHKADVFAMRVSGTWNGSTEVYDPSCPASLHGGCTAKHEDKFGKCSVPVVSELPTGPISAPG